MSTNIIDNIQEQFKYLLAYDSDEEDNTDNRCKITDSVLQDNSIELSCGHKFNYIPLYNEIKYQKTNKYSITYDYTRLGIDQLKCPYCREITNNILPYFNYYSRESGIELIRGVNHPAKYSLKIHGCDHRLKTTGLKCNASACKTPDGILCNRHYSLITNKCTNRKVETATKNPKNLENPDTRSILQKMRIVELKSILKMYNCRVGGNKHVLIDRIIYEKLDFSVISS